VTTRLCRCSRGRGAAKRRYREVLKEAHRVGEAMSGWQSAWTAHVVHGVNRELFELFNGDEEKIYEMLERENLLDMHRCYSVLKKSRKGYRSVPYAKAFRMEVQEVEKRLRNMRGVLERMEDEVFGEHNEWLAYIDALIDAFTHRETEGLIKRWAEVDRRWMAITAPIQIGHHILHGRSFGRGAWGGCAKGERKLLEAGGAHPALYRCAGSLLRSGVPGALFGAGCAQRYRSQP